MAINAGDLNRRITIEQRGAGKDEWGQPTETWLSVGEVWAGIAGETGLGAIRSNLQAGAPASIARYSFLVRFEVVGRLGINPGMRIVYDGLVFDIKGVTRDLKDRTAAWIITEQGGNSG
ncbi:phage head closure protein [Stenotrophomonas acidaminiphila]|uniref:phage head closure protein n=1 Tax=Stenotrophomonas acidaminiphila TaxID=128780 RepID=UPI0028AF6477|nr:phage head closure protein [Stenotrophomonas acidaminiphila]